MLTPEEEALLKGVSVNTVKVRTKDWIDNFFANLPHVLSGLGIRLLHRALQDIPIIIVGAGPSLDKNIDQLKDLRNRACICACDAALEAVLNAGCRPHLVLTADSKKRVSRYLLPEEEGTGKRISTEGIPLIADTRIHPAARDAWEGEVLWYLNTPTADSPFSYHQVAWTGQIGALGSGGCVTSTIWCLSLEMLGTNPNIFLGQDCSFKDVSHHHANCVANTEKYTVETLSEELDINGDKCFSNNPLKSFLFWFEEMFANKPGIHINCTEGGLLSRGCLVMPLADATERHLQKEYDIDALISAAIDAGRGEMGRFRNEGFNATIELPSYLATKEELSQRNGSLFAEGAIDEEENIPVVGRGGETIMVPKSLVKTKISDTIHSGDDT